MKLNEMVKCPHCSKEDFYVFYDNTETLDCNFCNKPFDITLKTKVEVIARLPKRICCICENKFIANDSWEDEVKCPECGHKGGHYEDLSER